MAICGTSAFAGDVPLQGPVPDWVVPAPELDAKSLGPNAPAYPLFDEQTLLDGGKSVEYVDSASTISTPEQLGRFGTLSMSWQPQHGDLTVHRIEILRAGQRIDLLKNGLGFAVLRREAGLESQIIDGRLTAVRQIEGLRIGDVLRMAFSVSVSDSLLGGKAQTGILLIPKPVKIGFGRARLVWPKAQIIAWKIMMPGIAEKPKAIGAGRMELSVAMPVAALPEMPKDAPVRFKAIPVISATSFAGWGEVSSVMAPLYRPEGTIAENSDLAKAVDALVAAHADPVARLAAALRMVQSDVRYQLIALGTGNYQPQAPAQTWAIRYGDCKAKTLLLLAMLQRMGIKAEPVLANSQHGGLIPTLLPAAQAFDHVMVRAEVAGNERIVAAHEQAVTTALSYLEEHAALRRRELGEVVHETTGRLLFARFTEHASRELDPHLHTHVVVLIARDAEYRVVGIGREANGRQIVRLADEQGRIVRWDPRLGQARQVNVFNREERDLAEGDRIQWRLATKDLDLKNAERGTVEKLDGAQATIRWDRGEREQTIDLSRHKTWDHGYAETVYSAQSRTYARVYHSPTKWRQRRYAMNVARHMQRRFGDDVFSTSARSLNVTQVGTGNEATAQSTSSSVRMHGFGILNDPSS